MTTSKTICPTREEHISHAVEPQRRVLGDYNWVCRTRDLRSPQKLLPYWGAGWYWRAAVEWMLDARVVARVDIQFTMTASAHFPASYLATRLECLEDWWTQAQEETSSPVEPKFAGVAMLGIWSILEHYAYHLQVASDPDDVVATVTRKIPTPGSDVVENRCVLHGYATITKMATFASLRPVHQICLDQERLMRAKLAYVVERQFHLPRCFVSVRNDGVSLQPGKQLAAVRQALAEMTYGQMTRLQHLDPLRRRMAPVLERFDDSTRQVFRLKEYKEDRNE